MEPYTTIPITVGTAANTHIAGLSYLCLADVPLTVRGIYTKLANEPNRPATFTGVRSSVANLKFCTALAVTQSHRRTKTGNACVR